jgi:hypothetical protein
VTADPTAPRRADVVCDAVAAAFIILALLAARHATADLPGAHDPDHFRDIAQAQTVRDGHFLSDPYYRGEWAWYNPLLAWTLALGSSATRTTVEEFHVHGGPWLNLLAPLMFYLLAVRLTGRRAALGGLTLYLFFITGQEHSWAAATYSPWLFSDNFSEGLFFSAALAVLWTEERPGTTRAAIAGALMGVTFLAHTAPALILAIMACALWYRRWRMLLVSGGAALLCASPFLGVIALHYHFHVVHAAPLVYQYAPVSTEGFVATVRHNGWLIAAALAGLWIVRSRFLATWIVVAFAMTLYALAPPTPLLPAFHFWLYVTAALAVLAGALLAFLARNTYLFAALAVILVAWHWNAYVTRPDFQAGRFLSARRNADHIAAAAFLRTVAQPDDVVLGNDGVVRLIIGVAGRKTVAPDPLFANPYVEYESRRADRDRLLTAVEQGDLAAFRPLASQRDISVAVMNDATGCTMAARMFPLTWQLRGDICVSIVRDRPDAIR